MSHFIKIDIKIKATEKECLFKALTTLKWEVVENAIPRSFERSGKHYTFVGVNPDTSTSGYDVGMEEVDGFIVLATDYYGGSVEKTLGRDMGLLKQQFAAEVIQEQYWGSQISQTMEDGNLILEVTV